jgi:hypothetical protein
MKREIARASMGNGECRDHDQPNHEITHKRPPLRQPIEVPKTWCGARADLQSAEAAASELNHRVRFP